MRTSKAIWPAVAASAGAKTKSWIAQPNSGRIGRSPGAVDRMIRIASSTSRVRVTSSMPPVTSVRIGKNAHPDADELLLTHRSPPDHDVQRDP